MTQKRERGRGRGTLIITDRTMDTVGPLLHEMTYQAMANDLLNIVDGVKYTCAFIPYLRRVHKLIALQAHHQKRRGPGRSE